MRWRDVGDPTPDFTYGLSNTFTWRRFELSGLLQGSHGGKILNVNRIRTEAEPRANISRARWEGRWTPENPDAKYPRVGENPNTVGPNNFSSNLLEDGSYLRLRTVTLSYGAPAWLFGARLYVTGTNLLTWTDYSGFDPDVSGQSVGNTNRGIDIGAKTEIYLIMGELAARGAAIVMVSSELPELISVADRIMVMQDGRMKGIVSKKEATQERVMSLATQKAQ